MLRKLNILNSKKSKDSIDKLINLMKIDQKTNKSFNSETVFIPSVLLIVSTSIIFEKIIEFLIEFLKIRHLNNARAVIVDEIKKIFNVTLYQQSINLSVNVSVDFGQMSVQITQINIFNSRNYYDCVKFEHKINDCSKMN